MDARYLGSAVVVTLLSSVSIRVSNSFILKQRSSYVIAQLSSPIRFSLGSLSLYTGLLALNVVLRRLYLCLCLTLGPSLVPLNACMFCGCPAPVWEDPAQKSLLDLIAPSSTDDLVQR